MNVSEGGNDWVRPLHRVCAGMTKEAAAQWLKDIHDRYIVELW